MRKNQAPKTKLSLSRETLRHLADTQLDAAHGGMIATVISDCHACLPSATLCGGCPGTGTQISCVRTDCCLEVP